MEKPKFKYLYGILYDQHQNKLKLNVKDNLEIVSFNHISALICNVDEIITPDEEDKKKVAQLLIHHQQILEKIMQSGFTVLPMKLATYLESKEEVSELLENSYEFLKNLQISVINKIEVDIVGSWANFPNILKKIGEDARVKELNRKIISKKEGVTLTDQQEIGFLISKLIKAYNSEKATECNKFLERYCSDCKSHDVMNDQMIFNTAFLVENDKINSFDNAIDELDSKYQGNINFRYVGPLPAYSFYTVELVKTNYKKLIHSKNLLDIKDSATLQDIKKAYRSKAILNHPDRKGSISTHDFDEINQAYRYLLNTFSALKNTNGKLERLNFTKEQLNDRLLLKLKE